MPRWVGFRVLDLRLGCHSITLSSLWSCTLVHCHGVSHPCCIESKAAQHCLMHDCMTLQLNAHKYDAGRAEKRQSFYASFYAWALLGYRSSVLLQEGCRYQVRFVWLSTSLLVQDSGSRLGRSFATMDMNICMQGMAIRCEARKKS